ncbi:hypothetical protein ColLi_09213 [Colletotrichum liriopes]|uniref:Uncharacterized protein n=1 Tax=Colletotrichum liriopes TaxID=708192 RepID=A0AA37GSI3_9PEZI|nr:hypothetical protein ColLi_09213 [Colletotrichum liriopes]
MGLNRLFHFDEIEYATRIASSKDAELVQREVVKTRQIITAYITGGTYLAMAIPSLGKSLIMAPLPARKYFIAKQKLNIVQAELVRRKIPLYETRKRDVAIPALTGALGLVVGTGTVDVAGSLTEGLMFSPSGASTIDALSADPVGAVGDALHGAAAQVQEVGANISGDSIGQPILPEGQVIEVHDLETGAATDIIVATPEVAGAWDAGVKLALLAEKAFASFLATAALESAMQQPKPR